MNADLILKSDLIDIVFECRNKEYGAYELRKKYNKHLLIAIAGPVAILVLSWWWVQGSGNKIIQAMNPGIIDTTIYVIQPPPPQSLPPEPVMRAIKIAASASTEIFTPVISKEVETTDVPEASELLNGIIGKKTDAPIGEPSEVPTPAIESETFAKEVTPIDSIFRSVEQMPEFPGGMAALSRFMSKHLKVPDEIDEPGTRVRIVVNFIVSTDGSLQSVQFKDSIPVVYEKEIRRVFNKMPKWNPGSQNGKSVPVNYHLPIIFEIPEL